MDGDGHGREGGHVCPPLPVRRGRRRRIRGQVKCVKKKRLIFFYDSLETPLYSFDSSGTVAERGGSGFTTSGVFSW